MPDDASPAQTDWTAIAAAMAPVETLDDPTTVKRRSRDFFWYSPILNAGLRRSFGDLVVRPKSPEELAHCLSVADAHDVPIVMRGGGTGNYGQAVPVQGGLIIDTTAMNQVLEIGEGYVRAQAGALMEDVNAALMAKGWEMAMFPSTQDIATIGGFIAGGSAGIGSIANGNLRQKGNIIQIKVLSVGPDPQEFVFEGDDVHSVHHAWGINGAITEVTLRTVPTEDWVGCMAGFARYRDAYAAGYALAVAPADMIGRKLCSVADARIAAYYKRLEGHLPKDQHLLVTLIPRDHLPALEALVTAHNGTVHLALGEPERQASKLPHVFEFAYNHTTLQVLKHDRSATYQQIGVPDAADADLVARMRDSFGDEVWPHHEFSRSDGVIYAADLPIIWFTTPERLAEINAAYEAEGFIIYDAHINAIEGNNMQPDYGHLAWKKRLDPKGLLNPGKSRAWEEVKHLSADDIAALGAKANGLRSRHMPPYRLTPLRESFGVEVHDIDLSSFDVAQDFHILRTLFEEHSALLFRGQSLDADQHLALARAFGDVEDRYADERKPGQSYTIPEVSNVKEDGSTTGEMDLHTLNLKSNFLWHSDSTFLPVPAIVNILAAKIVTTEGGATEIASTRAAWTEMPAALRAKIEGRGIWHRYSHSRKQISEELSKLPMFNKWPDQHWKSVWTNPVNGREALYLASHAFAVDGYDEAEGQALLAELIAFYTQPKYVYSHRWSEGDVLLWDQRAVMHRGTPWPYDQPRKLASLCASARESDGLDLLRIEEVSA